MILSGDGDEARRDGMTALDWIVSLACLAWLVVLAVFDIRERKVPHLLWTAIPVALAAAYRLAAGPERLVVAAAAAAVAASERRQLKNRAVEWIVFTAAAGFFLWTLTTASGGDALGIIGVCVFWLSWEMRWIGGADAMALITCLLVWPGIAFVLAYLAAGLIWSLGVRMKEGGWRRAHWVPGLAIVATAGAINLANLTFFHWFI
jgi:Flp pilus assembly protein protease CpaA